MHFTAVLLLSSTLSSACCDPVLATLGPALLAVGQADRPLVSGERARLQRMMRDMDSAMETLNSEGASAFQQETNRQRWEQRLTRFRTDLERLPQADDPDLHAARAKLAQLQQAVDAGMSQGGAQLTELGDVQGTLAGIENALREHQPPQWLQAPFNDAEADAWAQRVGMAKHTAEQALEQLAQIGASADLPLTRGTVQQGAAYDRQDIGRLQRFAEGNLRAVDEALEQTLSNLRSQFEAQDRELEYYRNLDPSRDSDRMNAFLGDGAEERIYQDLDRHLAFALSAAAYQRASGREPGASTMARVSEIQSLRQRYAEGRRAALGESRLPESRSNDAERLAIAQRILAEPRNEFGTHGPVVLTTENIVERERTVSRAEIKDVERSLSGDIRVSGTETTWTYRWKEFGFVTPIKDEDTGQWHLWWITARNYSSGWERTPIGRWVSAVTTKGDQIPEANFRQR